MNKWIQVFLLGTIFACGADKGSDTQPNGVTRAGSMAAFALAGDILYTIDKNTLVLFDISNPASITKKKIIYLQDQLKAETLYPYNDHLFVGTPQGVLIYDITNPLTPIFLSKYEHLISCDPVVASGNYAYATLRTESVRCNRGANRLEVIDISDFKTPKSVAILNLVNPHGLDVDDSSMLFICDGDNGFKIVSCADNLHPKTVGAGGGFNSYDVITFNKLAIMTGADGLYQYKYNDPAHPEFVSKIPILK